MRILHTSDWHLGAHLDGRSRLEEQEIFLNELVSIADQKQVDLVLIAGDVFDNYNPSAQAEVIYYRALKHLSNNRLVVVVAGNHDNPDRLMAALPLAKELGILIFGTPKTRLETGTYGQFFVELLGDGCVSVTIRQEKAVILAMPFASEKRLNEWLTHEIDESVLQKHFSLRMAALFAQNEVFFSDNTVNLVVGHFHIAGGEVSQGNERDIQLGGSFAVWPTALPQNAQYIAMGHLHRAQQIKCNNGVATYCGSPLSYGLGEANLAKSVHFVQVVAGGKAATEKIYLSCPKPIEIWEFGSVEEAIAYCEAMQHEKPCYIYILIHECRSLKPSETKALRTFRPDIVRIEMDGFTETNESFATDFFSDKSLEEEFVAFYTEKKKIPPSEEMKALFREMFS